MKYAVFITTHGRPDRVYSYEALRKGGYTGRIYVVVDDKDITLPEYRAKYKTDLIVYNKQACMDNCDTVIHTTQDKSVTYPRIAVEELAKEFGLDTFIVMDDDITSLRYRWIEGSKVRSKTVNFGLDKAFHYMLSYIKKNNIAVSSFVDMMFYISGISGVEKKITERREAYQIFLRNTDYPIDWIGVMRQDMLTNSVTSQRGYLWWTLPFISYDAVPMNETGRNEGGMIDAYKEYNEYKRSFLGVIVAPASLSVGNNKSRIKILWDKSCSYPMIISGRYKK